MYLLLKKTREQKPGIFAVLEHFYRNEITCTVPPPYLWRDPPRGLKNNSPP